MKGNVFILEIFFFALKSIFFLTFCRLQEWLKVVSREDLNLKSPKLISKNYRVCSAHFMPNMYKPPNYIQLEEWAVPVLKLKSQSFEVS